MDHLLITDAIRFCHLGAVALGLGTSILADGMVATRLLHSVSDAMVDRLHRLHMLVVAALVLLWATGLSLVALKTGLDPDRMTPKLWSKLAVVTLLTANGWVLGRIALPRLARSVGRRPVDLPLGHSLIVAVACGVSAGSWLLALAMGVSRTLAAADWSVFAVVIPAIYGLTVAGALTLTLSMRIGVQLTRPPALDRWTRPDPLTPRAAR